MAGTPLQLDSFAKLLSALPQQADFGQGDGWNDLSPRSSLSRGTDQKRPSGGGHHVPILLQKSVAVRREA